MTSSKQKNPRHQELSLYQSVSISLVERHLHPKELIWSFVRLNAKKRITRRHTKRGWNSCRQKGCDFQSWRHLQDCKGSINIFRTNSPIQRGKSARQLIWRQLARQSASSGGISDPIRIYPVGLTAEQQKAQAFICISLCRRDYPDNKSSHSRSFYRESRRRQYGHYVMAAYYNYLRQRRMRYWPFLGRRKNVGERSRCLRKRLEAR